MTDPRFLVLALALLLLGTGCGSGGKPMGAPCAGRVVCFVPGVGGDNGGYSGLRGAIRESGAADVRGFSWGAPGPFFFLNFQSTAIHDSAEKELAERITAWRRSPDCQRIDLIGHSAGGGVILGALRRLGNGVTVDRVVLLSPSVSPTYELELSLKHVNQSVDVFYSAYDVFFLKWRTSTFGTYDNVKTPAAGHLGFQPRSPLPPNLRPKLVQHPYVAAWKSLGNDGDHLGSASHDFVRDIVAPLLNRPD